MDASEHEMAKESITDTIARLRLGFQVIGFDWRYVYINPAAAAHGRRMPRQLIGRTMMEAYPGIDKTPLFAHLRRCMTDRRAATIDNEFTFPDGSSRWFEVRIEPVPEGLCVYSFDIHDRKVHEAASHATPEELASDLAIVRRLLNRFRGQTARGGSSATS